MLLQNCILLFILQNSPSTLNIDRRRTMFLLPNSGLIKSLFLAKLRENGNSSTNTIITTAESLSSTTTGPVSPTTFRGGTGTTIVNRDNILLYKNTNDYLDYNQDKTTTTTEVPSSTSTQKRAPLKSPVPDSSEFWGEEKVVDVLEYDIPTTTPTTTTTTTQTPTKVTNKRYIDNEPQFGANDEEPPIPKETKIETTTRIITTSRTRKRRRTTTFQSSKMWLKKLNPHMIYTIQKIHCFTQAGGYFLSHILVCLHDPESLRKLKFTAKLLLNNGPEEDYIPFYRCMGRIKIDLKDQQNQYRLLDCFAEYNLNGFHLDQFNVVNDFLIHRLNLTGTQINDFDKFKKCVRVASTNYEEQKVNDCIDINPILFVVIDRYEIYLESVIKAHKV